MDAVTLAMIKGLGGSGGSSLPTVSSSDNGKVLAVKDEEWVAQGDIVLNASNASLDWTGNAFAIIVTSDPPSEDDVASCFKSARGIMLVFSENWKVRLTCVEFDYDSGSLSNFYNFAGFARDFDERKCTYYLKFQFTDGECVGCGGGGTYEDKFIVTLTPTAADYSGTMDKTVAEINAAYEAGQDIWFNVGGGQAYVPLNIVSFSSGYDYPSFECYLVNPGIGTGVIMYAYTQFTSDGTKQTYYTQIYSLTPAS